MQHEGKSTSPFTRGDYRTATAAGMLALLVYLYTLAPTVTGEDSGELIGAAWSLGVPHPPGYPVWTLLAHLFSWIPIGDPGWRVNLLSAVCGAGTITLLVLLGITLTGHRAAAFGAALIFAFSRVFWEQAMIAEVYTLNTLWIALLLLLVLRLDAPSGPRRLYALALLAGAGTGVHNTLILCLPFFALLAWRAMPPDWRFNPGCYLRVLAAFCAGTLVHVYLPIASHFDPAVDWGDPETFDRWLAVLRRDQFAFMVDQYPRSTTRFAGQLETMALFWFRDLLGLGTLLGLWGGMLLFARERFLTLVLGALATATVLAITWMQNFEQSREWLWVMRVFLLPAELITSLGIACALAWGFNTRPRLRPFVAGLVLALLLLAIPLHGQQSKRNYYFARDYGTNILAALPDGAIYVPAADHQAFPVLYLQAVEKLRPDITILRKYGHLDLSSIPGLDSANPREWGTFPPRRHEPEILGWVLNNTDRPVFLSRPTAITGAEAKFTPVGLLVQALRPGETPAPTPASLVWRKPLPEKAVREYSLSLIQYDVALASAQEAFARNDLSAALKNARRAADFGHREPEILNNIGVLCARNGALEAAADFFQEILDKHPDHPQATANLARVNKRLGR